MENLELVLGGVLVLLVFAFIYIKLGNKTSKDAVVESVNEPTPVAAEEAAPVVAEVAPVKKSRKPRAPKVDVKKTVKKRTSSKKL
jgi:hypothetical protein